MAVKALTTPGHEGKIKIYELTGPELLSYAEVVQKVAAGTGKPLRFVDVPEATWRQEMLSAGAALPVVESLLAYFGRGVSRPARTFDEWLRDNAAALR